MKKTGMATATGRNKLTEAIATIWQSTAPSISSTKGQRANKEVADRGHFNLFADVSVIAPRQLRMLCDPTVALSQ